MFECIFQIKTYYIEKILSNNYEFVVKTSDRWLKNKEKIYL